MADNQLNDDYDTKSPGSLAYCAVGDCADEYGMFTPLPGEAFVDKLKPLFVIVSGPIYDDPRYWRLRCARVFFIHFSFLLTMANTHPQETVEMLMDWFKLKTLFLIHGDVRKNYQNHPWFECFTLICGLAKRLFEWTGSWECLLDVISKHRFAPTTSENIANIAAELQILPAKGSVDDAQLSKFNQPLPARKRRNRQPGKRQIGKRRRGDITAVNNPKTEQIRQHHKACVDMINNNLELLDKALTMSRENPRRTCEDFASLFGVGRNTVSTWFGTFGCYAEIGKLPGLLSHEFLPELQARRDELERRIKALAAGSDNSGVEQVYEEEVDQS